MIHDRESLFSKPDLRERGWTDGLMRRFLPPPDDLRDNPYYTNAGSPMSLWLRDRVQEIEATDERKAAREKSARRQSGAKDAVMTKTANLAALAVAVKITVERVSRKRIEEMSKLTYMGNYNGAWREYPGFDDRAAVNCIRHNFTEYDDALRLLVGKVGKDHAYTLLKNRVLDEIARVYPEYAEECAAQRNGFNTRQQRNEMRARLPGEL